MSSTNIKLTNVDHLSEGMVVIGNGISARTTVNTVNISTKEVTLSAQVTVGKHDCVSFLKIMPSQHFSKGWLELAYEKCKKFDIDLSSLNLPGLKGGKVQDKVVSEYNNGKIPFRRRGFEADAMATAIISRWKLKSDWCISSETGVRKSDLLRGLQSEANKMCENTGSNIQEVHSVENATHVLIVLTGDLLKNNDQQEALWDVHDENWYARERWFDIVTVYDSDWEFYEDKNQQLKVLCDDQRQSTTTGLLDKTRLREDKYIRVLPAVIQSLTGHEAMCYRGNGVTHEETAMFREFLHRMKTIDPKTGKRRQTLRSLDELYAHKTHAD